MRRTPAPQLGDGCGPVGGVPGKRSDAVGADTSRRGRVAGGIEADGIAIAWPGRPTPPSHSTTGKPGLEARNPTIGTSNRVTPGVLGGLAPGTLGRVTPGVLDRAAPTWLFADDGNGAASLGESRNPETGDRGTYPPNRKRRRASKGPTPARLPSIRVRLTRSIR